MLAKACGTCWEGELNLLLDDLHSYKVVFLIKAAIVEQKGVSLSRSKPGKKKHGSEQPELQVLLGVYS